MLKKGPKPTVAAVSTAMGGILEAESPGVLQKQVENLRRSVKHEAHFSGATHADELFVVMQQAKLGDTVGLFVRVLKTSPA